MRQNRYIRRWVSIWYFKPEMPATMNGTVANANPQLKTCVEYGTRCPNVGISKTMFETHVTMKKAHTSE